jgi:hypothetical protein
MFPFTLTSSKLFWLAFFLALSLISSSLFFPVSTYPSGPQRGGRLPAESPAMAAAPRCGVLRVARRSLA